MITVFFRTAATYIILIFVMRIMGKRQLGEMQISELVTAIMLSELAVRPISDAELPIWNSIIPVAALISLEILLTYLTIKSRKLKYLIDGSPGFLVYKGKLDIKELARLRISIDELLGELRRQGIAGISDAEYVIVEQNGQLSSFPKSETTVVGIDHPLVIDGAIFERNVALTGYNLDGLTARMKLSDVFLFSVDDAGHETLILKRPT